MEEYDEEDEDYKRNETNPKNLSDDENDIIEEELTSMMNENESNDVPDH